MPNLAGHGTCIFPGRYKLKLLYVIMIIFNSHGTARNDLTNLLLPFSIFVNVVVEETAVSSMAHHWLHLQIPQLLGAFHYFSTVAVPSQAL